jgi:hypothetical protein
MNKTGTASHESLNECKAASSCVFIPGAGPVTDQLADRLADRPTNRRTKMCETNKYNFAYFNANIKYSGLAVARITNENSKITKC